MLLGFSIDRMLLLTFDRHIETICKSSGNLLCVLACTPGAPRRALMVEGWKKKHAYVGFVYIPAKGCDLKSFVIINLQRKILLIYCLLKHEVTNSQNNWVKLHSLYVMYAKSLYLKWKQQNNLLINKILNHTKHQAEVSFLRQSCSLSLVMYWVTKKVVGSPS